MKSPVIDLRAQWPRDWDAKSKDMASALYWFAAVASRSLWPVRHPDSETLCGWIRDSLEAEP